MKIEMHTHTGETSPCAHVDAATMISLYKQANYQGVVVTDHYNKWGMEQSHSATREEYLEIFFSGYRKAVEAAKSAKITVFLGAEVNLLESPNDYLLYGAQESFFYEQPLLFNLSLKELYQTCHKNGILIFQAHPNRTYCTPANHDWLDGAEVYNGNPRHKNNNNKSLSWATEHHLIPSSGSDFHELEDLAQGGILTEQNPTDWTQLKDILKKGDYEIIDKS